VQKSCNIAIIESTDGRKSRGHGLAVARMSGKPDSPSNLRASTVVVGRYGKSQRSVAVTFALPPQENIGGYSSRSVLVDT